ncbi:unnamed protein product, partial [marine sediment metagenome]
FHFEKMHRWDKKALHYFLLMKRYYDEKSVEKVKEDQETKRKQDEMVKNAPKQVQTRRRKKT